MYHFRITFSCILWFWICCFGYYPCHCSGLWCIYCKSYKSFGIGSFVCMCEGKSSLPVNFMAVRCSYCFHF